LIIIPILVILCQVIYVYSTVYFVIILFL